MSTTYGFKDFAEFESTIIAGIKAVHCDRTGNRKIYYNKADDKIYIRKNTDNVPLWKVNPTTEEDIQKKKKFIDLCYEKNFWMNID